MGGSVRVLDANLFAQEKREDYLNFVILSKCNFCDWVQLLNDGSVRVLGTNLFVVLNLEQMQICRLGPIVGLLNGLRI